MIVAKIGISFVACNQMAGEIVDKEKNFCMNAVKFVLRTWAVLALALMPVGAAAEVRTESPAGGKGEIVICRGVEAHTCGSMVKIGQEAPDFRAVNAALEEVSLSSYRGKRVILNIFPSLDTPTCAMSVRQFNARASELENTVVLCLSMDLPFAQSRFCTTEGLENVVPLSLFRSRDFVEGYGLRLAGGPLEGLMARAVVVIGEDGKVRYTQLVKVISDEPDYEAALKAVSM